MRVAEEVEVRGERMTGRRWVSEPREAVTDGCGKVWEGVRTDGERAKRWCDRGWWWTSAAVSGR